jgi:hypothetical protein
MIYSYEVMVLADASTRLLEILPGIGLDGH